MGAYRNEGLLAEYRLVYSKRSMAYSQDLSDQLGKVILMNKKGDASLVDFVRQAVQAIQLTQQHP